MFGRHTNGKVRPKRQTACSTGNTGWNNKPGGLAVLQFVTEQLLLGACEQRVPYPDNGQVFCLTDWGPVHPTLL